MGSFGLTFEENKVFSRCISLSNWIASIILSEKCIPVLLICGFIGYRFIIFEFENFLVEVVEPENPMDHGNYEKSPTVPTDF